MAADDDDSKQEDELLAGWEGEPLQECSDLLYVLQVTNVTDQPLKFKLTFEQRLKDAQVNLVWPREGLVGTAAPNEEAKVVAVLPKKTATNDITDGLSEIEKLTVALFAEVD